MKTYLHLDIQNTNPPLLGNVLHRLHTRAIVIAPKLRMLHKSFLLYQFQKLFFGHKVVLDPVFLCAPRRARCVRDAEAEFGGIGGEEAREDCGFAGARRTGYDNGSVRLESG